MQHDAHMTQCSFFALLEALVSQGKMSRERANKWKILYLLEVNKLECTAPN